MRQALRRKGKVARGQVSRVYPQVAPVKGWIANENIVSMEPDSAYQLDNWFPQPFSIQLRPGYSFHNQADGSSVNTLMVYQAGATTSIFAAAGTSIFDVTQPATSMFPGKNDIFLYLGDTPKTTITLTSNPNVVVGMTTSTAVVTGTLGNFWIWTNFATSGGNWLVAADGVDKVLNYDGTSWTNPTITGVSSSTLNFVLPFSDRLWFLQKNSSLVWYLPSDSIQGAASSLNVGAELSLGGPLVAAAVLTYNGGFGPNNYICFISSQGEVVLYTGTDPNSASTFGLYGVFRIGRPIGNRCVLKVGGDVAVLTEDGVVSLSSSLQLDRTALQQAAFTQNIRTAFAAQYNLTGTLSGWQITTYPLSYMTIINVPTAAGITANQYVMNVLTGAWCQFTNMNATCWALAGDQLYFGTSTGSVMQFGQAGSDNGVDISAISVGAWSDMKATGVEKHVKAAQAFARATGDFNLGVNMSPDFNVASAAVSTSPFDASSSSGALWDVALWDQATWDSGQSIIANSSWLGVAESGYYIAPVILATANNVQAESIEFLSMNILYETGAPLG